MESNCSFSEDSSIFQGSFEVSADIDEQNIVTETTDDFEVHAW